MVSEAWARGGRGSSGGRQLALAEVSIIIIEDCLHPTATTTPPPISSYTFPCTLLGAYLIPPLAVS
jgi:hypothetical protein